MSYFTKSNFKKKLMNDTIILNEVFNRKKLLYIYQNQKKYKNILIQNCLQDEYDYDPFKFIETYLYHSGNNIKRSIYKRTKYGKNYYGRYVCCNSLQLMMRILKNTICNEFYFDVDIENCHPTIIIWLCKRYGIKCQYMEYYVMNRNEIIKKILELNQELDKGFVKLAILSLINTGEKKYKEIKNKTQWLINFYGEIKEIQHELIKKEIFVDIKKIIDNMQDKDNKIASTISIGLQEYENKILQLIINYFKRENIIKDNYVMCFDGLLIPKNNDKLKKHLLYYLKNCSNFIKLKMNIDIKLTIKSMNDVLFIEPEKLNNVMEEYYNLFDIKDDYSFVDFVNDYSTKHYDSYIDLVKELSINISRVIIPVENGELYYVIKINDDNNKYKIVKNSELNSNFYVVLDNENGSKKYNIKQCIQLVYKKLKIFGGLSNKPNNKNKNLFCIYEPIKSTSMECYNNDTSYNKIRPFINFIREIICDNDINAYKYVMCWLKILVTKPEIKTDVCLVLYSTEFGTGKSTFFDFLTEHVIGVHKTWNTSGFESLLNKFNIKLKNSRLVVIDETCSSKDKYYVNNEKFKNYITSNNLDGQAKYKNIENIQNLSNFGTTSNVDDSLIIKPGDRRFCCLRVSNKREQDFDYFEKLRNDVFNDECGNIFNTYLDHRVNYNINIKKPYMTDLKKKMINNHRSNIDIFYDEILKYELHDKFEVSADIIYNEYICYCNRHYLGKIQSMVKFNKFIESKNIKKIRIQKNGCRQYYYTYNIKN